MSLPSDRTTAGHPLRASAQEAIADWRSLVLVNREQVERLRESPPRGDFWEGRALQFRPGRLESPELEVLAAAGGPTATWLDVGAGGGRFAVPLAERCARVIAVEPSQAMREVLAASAAERGLANIEVVALEWPPPADAQPMTADFGLAAHMLYAIDEIGAFLEAFEASVRLRCHVILGNRAPSTGFEPGWTELWGEPLRALPALREFLGVLGALGRRFELRTFTTDRDAEAMSLDDAHAAARRLYWVEEGSSRDTRLRGLLQDHFGDDDGLIHLPRRVEYTGLVTWEPPGR